MVAAASLGSTWALGRAVMATLSEAALALVQHAAAVALDSWGGSSASSAGMLHFLRSLQLFTTGGALAPPDMRTFRLLSNVGFWTLDPMPWLGTRRDDVAAAFAEQTYNVGGAWKGAWHGMALCCGGSLARQQAGG
jgi:hypothetical protein